MPHPVQCGRRVHEQGHHPVAGPIGPGVGGKHPGQFVMRAHQHPDRLAVPVQQRTPDPFAQFVTIELAREDHVAAGDIGPDLVQPQPFAQRLQIGHRDLAGAADIDRPQQCDPGGHSIASIARAIATSRWLRPSASWVVRVISTRL